MAVPSGSPQLYLDAREVRRLLVAIESGDIVDGRSLELHTRNDQSQRIFTEASKVDPDIGRIDHNFSGEQHLARIVSFLEGLEEAIERINRRVLENDRFVVTTVDDAKAYLRTVVSIHHDESSEARVESSIVGYLLGGDNPRSNWLDPYSEIGLVRIWVLPSLLELLPELRRPAG